MGDEDLAQPTVTSLHGGGELGDHSAPSPFPPPFQKFSTWATPWNDLKGLTKSLGPHPGSAKTDGGPRHRHLVRFPGAAKLGKYCCPSQSSCLCSSQSAEPCPPGPRFGCGPGSSICSVAAAVAAARLLIVLISLHIHMQCRYPDLDGWNKTFARFYNSWQHNKCTYISL